MNSKGIFWVTGASSGIGRLAALELARRGWQVIASARRLELLESLAASHPLITALPLDVTYAAAVAAAVAQIETEHGPISGALLNAGGWNKDNRGAIDADAFAATYALNVMGVVNAIDPLLPLLQARGGQIAIVGSVAGYRGLPGGAYAYTSSKAAVIHLAQSLRIDYAQSRLKIQLINPGFVKTELTASNKHPMPFLLEAEEAACRLVDGLESDAFEIVFPRRMAWGLKLMGLLPFRLYAFWARKVSKGSLL